MSKIASIEITSAGKVAVAAAFLVLAAVSWFTVRWTLGVTVSAKADSKELADIAVGLAPDHPFSHLVAGIMLDKTFLPDDLLRSQTEFEKAVALSPNDFRLWLELARSYEKNGDTGKAESAFRKSLELAPNYSRVQWAAGNFLLRVDKAEEAFSLIKVAAEKEVALGSAAAAVAWNIYDGDLATIENYFRGSDYLQAGLVAHLAGEGRFEDAFRIWASLPADKRSEELRTTSDTLYAKLAESKRFLLILKMDELAGVGQRRPGSVSNAGFEDEIRLAGGDRFGWQFMDGVDAQIGIDVQQVRGGVRQRTLAMIFNSDGKSFRGVSQLVPVEPGARYSFLAAYRSEIDSRATMRWEVVDASDSKVLAATDPVAERSDWAGLKTEFTVPENSEGVVIRLVRAGCLSTICPLVGKVWFDDVVVSRL